MGNFYIFVVGCACAKIIIIIGTQGAAWEGLKITLESCVAMQIGFVIPVCRQTYQDDINYRTLVYS